MSGSIDNTAIGHHALVVSSGSQNTAVGYQALIRSDEPKEQSSDDVGRFLQWLQRVLFRAEKDGKIHTFRIERIGPSEADLFVIPTMPIQKLRLNVTVAPTGVDISEFIG